MARFEKRAPQATHLKRASWQLHLNRASAEELALLPSLGPQRAARIVEHRMRHGAYRCLDDLQEVPGIGPKTLNRIRPWLRL